MHRLLERQIRHHLGGQCPPEWQAFLDAVDAAYVSFDKDRTLIERSLELMSRELTEANSGLRKELGERKSAEEALQKEKAEQQKLIHKLEDAHSQLLQSEKMASIGQLAAGVAHEINNPIGYVYSNLGALEDYVQKAFCMLEAYEKAERGIAEADIQQALAAAKKGCEIEFLKQDMPVLIRETREGITRVKKIVQSLKDFSHADVTDEWRYADLHQGLDSTLTIVNNEIKYKAEVCKRYGALPEVECLPSQLNQVFMNLLVNAAQAIEEKGSITIHTGTDEGGVWVDIIDTGHGIKPEHIKKVFDPFFTTKPVGKGTGLGLSLSYSIVQKHHGHLTVESEPGVGTRFRVWLPVAQPPKEA